MMALHGDLFELEGQPTPGQQERLADFLAELSFISRKYQLLIDGYTEDGKTAVVDLQNGKVLGMELTYFLRAEDYSQVAGYDFLGLSILDGAWPCETPQGEKALWELDGRKQLLEAAAARRATMTPRDG